MDVDGRDIVSAREFPAPRELVFEAFSNPQRLAQWWGPREFTNSFEEFDLRPGGMWRLTMHGPDGTDYRMLKTFLEVSPPERVVIQHIQTMHNFILTMTFDESAKGTHLTWHVRFDSEEEANLVRDVFAAANEQNLDRLAAHLGSRA